MINASKEFKEKLKNGKNVVNYADFTLNDGTILHLEPKDFIIGGCTVEDKTTDGKFGVGFVVGKRLSIRIANHDERFSKYDFYQSVITLYVAMLLDNGNIEKIRKGIYYTVSPETPGDVIEVSAVDGMFRLDKDYEGSTTKYPATLQAIISDVCLDCGIPIGFNQFDNMNFTVKERPEKATYRQILSYACQIAGYNARIDNDGYMQLIWYNTALIDRYNSYVGGDFKTYPHETILDGGNFKDYSTNTIISGGLFTDDLPEHIFRIKTLHVNTDDIQITGVKVIGEDDVSVLFGEEGYLIEISGNPFAVGYENEVANYLGNRIVGMAFRPFSAEILNNPLYEPFDIVRVSDIKGNVYISLINSITYMISSFTQIACEAEEPARNGSSYASPSAQAVAEARKNSQKQLTTYDKAVQNMNQLANNALGFYTTYVDSPDGSRITYMHDKPLLEDSRYVYKESIDGFFISQDGGKTYTAGRDKNGNVVANILYAIGIVCDWIKGGTLTLGGNGNVNGELQVLDKNGEGIAFLDNTGLSVLKGIISGAKISVGGIDGSLGEISAYDDNGTLLFDLKDSGLNFYGITEDLIGRFAIAGYDDPTIKGLSQMLEPLGSNISWYSRKNENSGYEMKFMYEKSVDRLILGADLDSGYKDILFGDVARTRHYAYGLSLSAAKGNFISIGEDGNEKLRVQEDEIIFYTTGSRTVNCYNDLNMHGFSLLYESDERLKSNIKESSVDSLSVINDIQTYSFDWIEDESHEEMGFIAQQLESVNPDFVSINKKTDCYSIEERKLIPYLVKSIQELNSQIVELQNKVSELTENDEPKRLAKNYKIKNKKWNPTNYTNEEKKEFVSKVRPKDIDRTVVRPKSIEVI